MAFTFRHRSELTLTTMMLDDPTTVDVDVDFGVCHSDELFLLFHQPDLEQFKTEEDFEVGKKLLRSW